MQSATAALLATALVTGVVDVGAILEVTKTLPVVVTETLVAKVVGTGLMIGKELWVERKEAGGWLQPDGGHVDERAAPGEVLAKKVRKRSVVMSLYMVAIVVCGFFRLFLSVVR